MTKFYWFLGHEQFHPEVLIKHAQLAEEVGFDGLMVSEHFHPWVADDSASGYALSTLGAIAAVTKNISLMTAVTTPLYRYHPAVIAQAAATIDRISGGRFALGIGTGERINEAPLGYHFPPYKERAARLNESAEIMRLLLDGERVSYDGEYYKTHDAKLYSLPVHRLPIYIAAAGPKTAELAGRVADGVITSVKLTGESNHTVITPAKNQAGEKDFSIIANHWSVYAQTDEHAWQALRPWRGLRVPSRNIATDPRVLQDEADALSREKILSNYSILSTPDDYIKTYSPLVRDLEADIVGLQGTAIDQESLIKMVGREVLPALRNVEVAMTSRTES